MTSFKTALIVTAVLALAGAAHNASARDCSDPSAVICADAPLPAGTVTTPARSGQPASVVTVRRPPATSEPETGQQEELNLTTAERLEAEKRLLALRQQEEADSLEAKRQEAARQDLQKRRNIANGITNDRAARRGSPKSESEHGFNRSGSELGLDRSESERGR
jgi:hypothetical protein